MAGFHMDVSKIFLVQSMFSVSVEVHAVGWYGFFHLLPEHVNLKDAFISFPLKCNVYGSVYMCSLLL